MKRIIKPIKQIPVHEKIQSKERDQIRQRSSSGGAFLHPEEQEHRDECCPSLRLECILALSKASLDPQVLFERSDEDLELPVIFIDAGNRRGSKVEMIAQVLVPFARRGILPFYQQEKMLSKKDGLSGDELDQIVTKDLAPLRECAMNTYDPARPFLQTRDGKHSTIGQHFRKEHVETGPAL